MTFRICRLPLPLPKDVLERFAAAAAPPLGTVKDEPEWGWVSGRHLLERRIDAETSMLGGYLHLHLLKAERRIPSSLLTAECRMEELARMAANQSDRISRKERKTIREEVTERLLPQMPPQLAGTPFAIDASDSVLYVAATSQGLLDTFLGLFCRTVGFEPVPLTPEAASTELFEVNPAGLRPLNFSPALADEAAAGTLGQNFLTWLWFFLEDRQGVLPQTQLGEFSLMIDGPLAFVAEGPGAFESVMRKGLPTISAEAKAALTVGKKLKRAKLTLARAQGEEWSFVLDADEFIFRSVKLPEGEAMDAASVFEERMTNLYVLRKVFFALFQRFLQECGSAEGVRAIQNRAKEWVRERESK